MNHYFENKHLSNIFSRAISRLSCLDVIARPATPTAIRINNYRSCHHIRHPACSLSHAGDPGNRVRKSSSWASSGKTQGRIMGLRCSVIGEKCVPRCAHWLRGRRGNDGQFYFKYGALHPFPLPFLLPFPLLPPFPRSVAVLNPFPLPISHPPTSPLPSPLPLPSFSPSSPLPLASSLPRPSSPPLTSSGTRCHRVGTR